MGCIYKISNLITGKFYIGSTVNAVSRMKTHFSKLRHQKHDNRHLQSSFNKYGENAFVFEIIEEDINNEHLEDRELYFLKFLRPQYNKSTECVRPMTGVSFTEEHKRNISLAKKGKIDKRTPQQKLAAIAKSKIATSTLAFREKMSIATTVYYSILSEDEKAERNAHKVGRVFSKKTKKKLSEKAKAREWSEATKKKISESVKKTLASKRLNKNL